jgi:pyruvate,water dikinase
MAHAAIVSREMGIPAVVGTGKATSTLIEGDIVTVDGNNGKVYPGKTETKKAEIKQVVPTKIKIKVIVDLPDYAERAALSGCTGVGLVRLEGIIAETGKHPMYYVKENKTDEYIGSLVKGLDKIASYFNEVWIRSSDIRTDEFKNLQGSLNIEGNPMLGDHGIRFTLKHKEILRAELIAIKELADKHHDKKFGFMIPQVIGVDELSETKKMADEVGLPDNVKLGIMVETPAAVQLINQLCESGIKFISFGTNDLTQYTLAIDRNNPEVQHLYNEMHPAVLNSISYVIRRCKKYGVETSICGQAGSREDMAKFLLEQGIDSISCNADAAYNVSKIVSEIEGKLVNVESSVGKYPDKENEKKEENLMISHVKKLPIVDKDMEQVILSELENEYNPGTTSEGDTPNLNDAIGIGSDSFEEKKDDKILDFEN